MNTRAFIQQEVSIMNSTAQIVNIEERRPIVIANIERGYDRLAHTLTNTLMVNDAKLSAREMQVVFAIISKTYRFQKKEDWITNSQICDLTNLSKGHVSNLVKSLIAKNVIYKSGRNTGINKTVSEWKVHKSVNKKSSQIRVTEFTNSCTPVHKLMNNSSQIRETHKKETITKETITKERARKKSIPLPELPEFIPQHSLLEFIEHRKQIKKPMTELALTKFIEKLKVEHNNGFSIIELLDDAIANGWQTVYPKQKSNFGKNKAKPERFDNTDYGQPLVRF